MKKKRKERFKRIAERAAERRAARTQEATGTLRMTHSGYGFLKVESGPETPPQPDIFIPAKFVGPALDGDTVRIQILPPRKSRFGEEEKGPVGKIVEVLQRNRTEFVGELLAGARVRPLNPRFPDEIRLYGARKGASRGDWVRVKLDPDSPREGNILEVLGKAGVLAADLDAVMAEFELPRRYSEKEEAAAAHLEPRPMERRDNTGRLVVTIDPFDAKDFDDALSLAPGKTPGTVELGIHIADVAAFVPPKSKIDEMARLRGFSCYLPGRTLPMLPASLTAKISMQSGQDSCAHSVYLTVETETGKVIAGRREHDVIRVTHRLNYDEVQDFLDSGKAPAAWGKKITALVRSLSKLTRAMRSAREKEEQFIDLPLPEIRVICDEKKNEITGLSSKISRESEQIVEECMLAANQFVGNQLTERGIAGIYRVHPEPEEEKSMEFSDMMHDWFHLSAGNIADRAFCRRFIASLPDDGKRNVILGLLLRAMPRASYAVKGDLHFALGKFRYCHFTSPIRRYPDLLVHQQLWNADCRIRTRSAKTMETTAAWCSEQEEKIDAAYYAASDRMKLRYLEEELEKNASAIYEGVIVRVLAAGLQVEISELGLFGFVPRERMRGSFRRRDSRMSDERNDTAYRPGNYLYLHLDSIDFARGVANFLPAGR